MCDACAMHACLLQSMPVTTLARKPQMTAEEWAQGPTQGHGTHAHAYAHTHYMHTSFFCHDACIEGIAARNNEYGRRHRSGQTGRKSAHLLSGENCMEWIIDLCHDVGRPTSRRSALPASPLKQLTPLFFPGERDVASAVSLFGVRGATEECSCAT